MNRKGFTLMELLAVIAIVAFVSTAASIAFGNIDNTTSRNERKNRYIEIQRAASLYFDLNDEENYLADFTSTGRGRITVQQLKSENYISDIKDPLTGKEIPRDSFVLLYIATDPTDGKKYVDTCLVQSALLDDVEKFKCLADSKGDWEKKDANGNLLKDASGKSIPLDVCCDLTLDQMLP